MKKETNRTLKKCNNPKLAKKLIDFMVGDLPPEEMEAFDDHLFECDECRDMFYFTLEFEGDISGLKPSQVVKKMKE